MKLSVVTINRNNAEGLKRTLDSVKAQTFHDIEHIIIDGCSTDGSVDVIREYENTIEQSVTIDQSTIQVKWISEKDNGIYNAMNHGIEIALGKRVVNADHTSSINSLNVKHSSLNESHCNYIWILNSGDCIANQDVIARMMEILANESYPLLLGNIVHVYGDGRKVRERKRTNASDLVPRLIKASMFTFYRGTVPQDAAFVRRDLFEKFGYFDETMKICADWKLYLDMIALGGVIPMYVDIDVVYFDMSGVSNTNNECRLAERRAYLEQVLPVAVLKDYDEYAASIAQYNRIRKHHLWGLVRFVERVLFKFERWGILHK